MVDFDGAPSCKHTLATVHFRGGHVDNFKFLDDGGRAWKGDFGIDGLVALGGRTPPIERVRFESTCGATALESAAASAADRASSTSSSGSEGDEPSSAQWWRPERSTDVRHGAEEMPRRDARTSFGDDSGWYRQRNCLRGVFFQCF